MMKNPRTISITEFQYELPEDRIAKFPAANRDESKLLIYKDGQIQDDQYKNLAEHLPEHMHLVFNNTKVVEARLMFQKESGGVIEVFCLEPSQLYPDIVQGMIQENEVTWHCLVGGASKWKANTTLRKDIQYNEETFQLCADIVDKRNDYFIIRLSWNKANFSFAEVLHAAGLIPLPPYLNRKANDDDHHRYQTVYAQQDGSVAAPTAGLHFTPELFSSLEKKNIHPIYLTLHVGAGTFKPVKAEQLGEHDMHAEFIDIPIDTLRQLRSQYPNLIAVGTTSLRTLESLYWMGVKAHLTPNLDLPELEVKQWEAYDIPLQDLPVTDALDALLQWMETNHHERLICKTQILMAPPYNIRMCKALITNFHQPESTLLLLIATVVGEQHWKKIYDYALAHDYRFLSYGDGSLLWLE